MIGGILEVGGRGLMTSSDRGIDPVQAIVSNLTKKAMLNFGMATKKRAEDLTQEEFARYLDISVSALRKYLDPRGKIMPGFDIMATLSWLAIRDLNAVALEVMDARGNNLFETAELEWYKPFEQEDVKKVLANLDKIDDDVLFELLNLTVQTLNDRRLKRKELNVSTLS